MYFPLIKTVFIHIPKTGGTSIRISLLKHSHFENTYSGNNPHNMLKRMEKTFGHDIVENSFSFSIVRNPWERIVSLYEMHRRKNKFLDDIDFRTFIVKLDKKRSFKIPKNFYTDQIKWLRNANDKIGINKIYRFENLDSAWEDICLNIGIEHTLLPHNNKNEYDRSYHYYYDNITRPIVARWHEKDIDYFGFEFDHG